MASYKYSKPVLTQGGRSISKLLNPQKKGGSEHLSMRRKIQLKPAGIERFPWGKYLVGDQDWPPSCKEYMRRVLLRAVGGG